MVRCVGWFDLRGEGEREEDEGDEEEREEGGVGGRQARAGWMDVSSATRPGLALLGWCKMREGGGWNRALAAEEDVLSHSGGKWS